MKYTDAPGPPKRRQQRPYGLLVPVARVMTATAAGEIQRILAAAAGVRFYSRPIGGVDQARRWRRAARLARWPIQVLVFPEDAPQARRVLLACTDGVASR